MAKLLIVDDFDTKRLWMREILEANGHDIQEAEGGRDALVRSAQASFDLVITDINMPEMNGVELIRLLRDTAQSKLKILAISAGSATLSSDASLLAGRAVGADAILYMPCRPAEFLKIVSDLLRD